MTTENETAFDDFNLDTDVVETPLVPNGNYSGNITVKDLSGSTSTQPYTLTINVGV